MSAPVKTVCRFGTSGWRATDAFTEDAVRQITAAFADYLIETMECKGRCLPVMLGGDTRDKTRRFIPLIADMLVEKGIDVLRCDTDVPSPVLAYAAKYVRELDFGLTETLGAVLMTASHNPWLYGGYNFLTPDGAVMGSAVSKRVETLQETPANRCLSPADRCRLGNNQAASIRLFNPYDIYKAHLRDHLRIDFNAIRNSGLRIHYDPLYATGRLYLPRILREEAGLAIQTLHETDQRPSDYTGMPEPTGSELLELSAQLQADPAPLKVGLANDGDADRFGVLDETGRYVHPNDILLLVLHHLVTHRGRRGVVVCSQATTTMLNALAEHYDLPVIRTPVGYKYIAHEFEAHAAHPAGPQVLLGGEGSGGLSVLGHLPEKDGILANLLIAELIAVEKRPLSRILEDIHASLGQHGVFLELGVKTEHGTQIRAYFQTLQTEGGQMAGLSIDTAASEDGSHRLETTYGTRDGARIIFEDGSWLLVRASGTEPIVRIYVEAVDRSASEVLEKSGRLLEMIRDILCREFNVAADAIKEKT